MCPNTKYLYAYTKPKHQNTKMHTSVAIFTHDNHSVGLDVPKLKLQAWLYPNGKL
jgi:hypothetical protein